MYLRSLLILLCLFQASISVAKPNVLLILVDDLGYGDLSCYGADDLESPAIDDLAARGMTFTNFYANCPVCSPTRASLLSGRYPELVGVPGVIRTHAENNWGRLTPGTKLMPHVLKDAGYDTAIVGKWHLGLNEDSHPNNRGFDFLHGFLGDMMDDYYNHRRHGNDYMRKNGVKILPEGHATDLFSDWACEYLESRKEAEKPFFLYLAYNAPHTPIQPPEDWVAKVKQRQPGIDPARAKLVALIEHMDAGIGRVLAKLKQTGMHSDTLVIFSSDNGGQSSVKANNGSTRAGKGTMYEGGIKVPTIVSWPGKVTTGSKTDRIGLTMDFLPTICEAVGATTPEPIDGRSFLKTLLNQQQAAESRDLFFIRREGGLQYGGLTVHALRRGDWKLVQNSPYGPMELFNLANDPLEENNLAKQETKVFRELAAALRVQIQRGGAVLWQNPVRRDVE